MNQKAHKKNHSPNTYGKKKEESISFPEKNGPKSQNGVL